MARLPDMRFLLVIIVAIFPAGAMADDKLVRLFVPMELVETGVTRHALPRFSLKTQVRVELLETADQADVIWGTEGRAMFQQGDITWHLRVVDSEHAGARRFTDWLFSDIGQNTILGFAPDGQTIFQAANVTAVVDDTATYDGNTKAGEDVAITHCGRCHAVNDAGRKNDIGSTPSFFVLRGFEDWENRFATFFILRPHGAFTQISDLTAPFADNLPPAIVPIEMTMEEIDDLIAYVAVLEAADLGAPLAHQ